jgi:hypothetical protein
MRRAVVAAIAASVASLVMAAPAAADDTECVGILPPGTYDNVVVPDNTFCDLSGSQVRGNVLVRPGASAAIVESTIGGNVQGSHVDWVQLAQAEVRGDFTIDDALDPTIFTGAVGSTVGGSFSVARSRAGSLMLGSVQGDLTMTQSSGANAEVVGEVRGNVLVSENTSAFVNASSIVVGGNLVVTKNSTPLLQVAGNDVTSDPVASGNLVVEENVPGVMASVTDNDVTGNAVISKTTGPGVKEVVDNRVRQNLQCFDNSPPFVGGPNVAQQAEGQCF